MKTLKDQLNELFAKHGKTPEGKVILGEIVDILSAPSVTILKSDNIIVETQVDHALRNFDSVELEHLTGEYISSMGRLHLTANT